MKFEDLRLLSRRVKDNLAKVGYRRPTDIQFRAIPHILQGEDVLAIAQTGTGKTAAFAIPIISLIELQKASKRSSGIRCLVMAPTRELVMQTADVFEKIGKGTGVFTLGIFGGVEQDPQIARLAKGVDIIIATPGRLFDLASQGYITLDGANILVLDEADHMLALGFINDIRQLRHMLPKKRQTLFFSATIDDDIKKLAYSLVANPIRISIAPDDRVSRNVKHSVAYIEMDDKRFFLERLLKENSGDKILVFVRTKVRADRVQKALERVGIQAIVIHGDKTQAQRTETLANFKTGSSKILITTDVSARGIDIPNVDCVVNYDLPEVPETYVHRVGRTGRGILKGWAVSFASKEEAPALREIERFLGKPIEAVPITNWDYRDTVDFATEAKQDLKALLAEAEAFENSRRKKNKRKRQ